MKESLPLHDIGFEHAMQELNESLEQRKQREKERKRRECEERRERVLKWIRSNVKILLWTLISAVIYFMVNWLLSKCLK